VGEGQDSAGHKSRARISVQEAAEHLGTTVDAIRKRVQRDTIAHDKDADGRVWILLDDDRTRHATVRDRTGHRQDGESSVLISEMRDRIQFLEDEHRRKDAILLNMTEALRALSPPQEPAESPDSPAPDPTPNRAGAEPQEGVQRPQERSWWRRMFGG
jgi:hypothetical protein